MNMKGTLKVKKKRAKGKTKVTKDRGPCWIYIAKNILYISI
jgi:hypothetical protein